MMEAKKEVVSFLKDKTEEIQELVKQIDDLEYQKKNGHLDAEYIAKVVDRKLSELKYQKSQKKQFAVDELKKILEGYRQQVRNMNRVKGEELTEDAKLFTCGVPLRPEEVEAIMDRSAGNHTMLQLAARYAEQHNLRINRAYDSGKDAKLKAADGLEYAGKVYLDRWVDQDNSGIMLDKFFGGDSE